MLTDIQTIQMSTGKRRQKNEKTGYKHKTIISGRPKPVSNYMSVITLNVNCVNKHKRKKNLDLKNK